MSPRKSVRAFLNLTSKEVVAADVKNADDVSTAEPSTIGAETNVPTASLAGENGSAVGEPWISASQSGEPLDGE